MILKQKHYVVKNSNSFQNPYASLNPRKKIGSILEEPLIINTKLSAKERREKVLSMMEKVGLRAEFYDRYPTCSQADNANVLPSLVV